MAEAIGLDSLHMLMRVRVLMFEADSDMPGADVFSGTPWRPSKADGSCKRPVQCADAGPRQLLA